MEEGTNMTHVEMITKLLQKELLGKVKTFRCIDKKYMLKHGVEAPPHLDIHRLCIECDQIGGLSVIIEADMDEIRGTFRTFLTELFIKPTECPRCGGSTIPLGYTWSSLGWMLQGFDKEEVEQYYRVIGTIKTHPKKVEIFQTTTSTMIGVKSVIISRVNRSKEGTGKMVEEAVKITKTERIFPPPHPRKHNNKQEMERMRIISFGRDTKIKIEGGESGFLIDLPQYTENLSDIVTSQGMTIND